LSTMCLPFEQILNLSQTKPTDWIFVDHLVSPQCITTTMLKLFSYRNESWIVFQLYLWDSLFPPLSNVISFMSCHGTSSNCCCLLLSLYDPLNRFRPAFTIFATTISKWIIELQELRLKHVNKLLLLLLVFFIFWFTFSAHHCANNWCLLNNNRFLWRITRRSCCEWRQIVGNTTTTSILITIIISGAIIVGTIRGYIPAPIRIDIFEMTRTSSRYF